MAYIITSSPHNSTCVCRWLMKFEVKCSQNTVILLTLVFDESFQFFFQAIALNEQERETHLWHNFNITLTSIWFK